ncbi:IMP cyclohydrolase [Desulfovibrio litoralis]|uniref:Phosphoribosylaminoimidazolecarboxamide formyltransferase / IMP cyclohydrolase n=1 Tax=Desulfovibrio litoralis DSM 11393 TaxID=1121455 RepID=A0A1M7TKE0_9BACT|nr:IMP cyclohydrolase [Desulfovibrio litoralis]SHN71204.1 phosphoribosylaminoimidazolecarboxamide formyltransferase / IMP cyclohydrolase [Desulfovibrio litoralis DSM 11393]
MKSTTPLTNPANLKDMYKKLQEDPFPSDLTISLGEQTLKYRKRTWNIDNEEKGLRYGENPDQPAALYELVEGSFNAGGIEFRKAGMGLCSALTEAQMLQAGKHPGKTNLTDVDNGANILQYLHERPAALILKHNNPCGAAWSNDSLEDALEKAYLGDRIAAFGGAVIVNRPLNKESAELINSAYYEVVAAPEFEEGSLEILKARKNLRIIKIPRLGELQTYNTTPFLDIKSLCDGGLIIQKSFLNRIRSVVDFLPATAEKDGVSVSARKPTTKEAEDLFFAWAVEAGVSSNSVIFAKDGATVSIGTGEQDRIGCIEIAAHKAYTKYADLLSFNEHRLSIYELKRKALSEPNYAAILADIQTRTNEARGGLIGSSMVSDGFFPFRDGVDAATAEGVTAIAQPGGSLRDFEVIEAVNEVSPQVAMVFTGQRSFKH